MPSLLPLIRGLVCGSQDPSSSSSTVITRPGLFDATPDVTVTLLAPGPKVAVAMTGPDRGVTTLQQQQQQTVQHQHPAASGSFAGADISWRYSSTEQSGPQQLQQHAPQQAQQQLHHSIPQPLSPRQQQLYSQQHTWGTAVSLYDIDPLTGQRNGDPIADCFAAIAYQQGAIMALADGVNWGERPKAAARGAVLGFCSSLHQQLAYAQGGRKLTSTAVFAAMRTAVLAAQQHVKKADGTLTTLVGAVVCPKRWGAGHVLLAVSIGDSPCYVWRAASGTVEEVTYMPPFHGFHRDPRVCPGCLGYAIGDQPDLSNITFSLTHLQQGDLVFLTSDGIADNFDPVMRKQALASSIPRKSPRASAAAQAAAVHAMNGMEPDLTSHLYQDLCPASPATCHARAMLDMAKVLRNACNPQPQLQPQQSQPQPQAQPQQPLQQQQQVVVVVPGLTLGNGNGVLTNDSLASTASSNGGALTTASSNKSAAGELPAFSAGASLTARAAVDALIAFASTLTDAQRRVLEDAAMKSSSNKHKLGDIIAGLPGKLDHASVVAYKVGS